MTEKIKLGNFFCDSHHEEGEEGENLGEFAGPRVFDCAPQPRAPLKVTNKEKAERRGIFVHLA